MMRFWRIRERIFKGVNNFGGLGESAVPEGGN